jgi:hypothetical protein
MFWAPNLIIFSVFSTKHSEWTLHRANDYRLNCSLSAAVFHGDVNDIEAGHTLHLA